MWRQICGFLSSRSARHTPLAALSARDPAPKVVLNFNEREKGTSRGGSLIELDVTFSFSLFGLSRKSIYPLLQ